MIDAELQSRILVFFANRLTPRWCPTAQIAAGVGLISREVVDTLDGMFQACLLDRRTHRMRGHEYAVRDQA